MRLATLVRCLFALFPPSSSAPGEQSERSSQREFVRAPIPMHDYVYIPLYIFPGNTWLAVWERDETGPVRCWLHAASRKLGDVLGGGSFGWSESEISTREGGGEGELRRSGKVSILSLLFRYLWDGRECTICNNDNKKVGDLGVGV